MSWCIEQCKQELTDSVQEGVLFDPKVMEALKEGFWQKIEQEKGSSVSAVKLQAVLYLMENAPLAVHPQELFAWRIGHGGLMREYYLGNYYKVLHKRRSEEAAVLEKKKAIHAEMDFGHVAPDWSYLLSRGFGGVAEDLREEKKKHEGDEKALCYYDERIAVYRGMQELCLRFAQSADGGEKGSFVAENLRVLAKEPPKTMAQAMQFLLLYYVLQTNLDTVTIRSLGGLDRLLVSFYRRDLQNGRVSEQQQRELIKHFFFQISLMKVTANLPFYLCGRDDEGADATNELTRVLLECYRQLDLYDPKIHVLYHEDMDPQVLRLILEMIREGKNSFVFLNLPIAQKALEQIGIAPEDARRVTVYGCYETAAEGTEVPCTCAGMINLVAPLEAVLQGEEEFSDFEALLDRVLEKIEENVSLCMATLSSYEQDFGQVCPSLMMSASFQSSRESAVDLYEGGAKYNNTSVVGAGMATLTDSLAAIKTAVYEEKSKTLEQMRAILQKDWQGEELFCLQLKKKAPHFGNNDPKADAIAQRIYQRFAHTINGKKNGRGGVFRCGVFSVDWRMWMGKNTLATPDGRRAGEPISKNLAPVLGQDKQGVTAYLQSLLKLDATLVPDGSVADVVLHSSAVKGEDGMAAFGALLSAFMKQGGFGVHFNVLRPEDLKKAQKEPQKYRNLQIRLCGWNARFVDLDKAQQDEFILQAEKQR